MSENVFHANGWTICVEPIPKGSGVWASKWTAARGAPKFVGKIQREVEISSSGEIDLHGSESEAVTRAKDSWLIDQGSIRHTDGAAFVEPAVFGDWHIGISVLACDMSHTAPIWMFRGNAIHPVKNIEEKFSSGAFRFSSVEEAFEEGDRLLTERYGPRDK
ncbi:TPA: hypothetical protein QDB14_004227 [Burkholderia vietnamiensis]|nr:hypothetical protein [Burkholderia vietnamiensis]